MHGTTASIVLYNDSGSEVERVLWQLSEARVSAVSIIDNGCVSRRYDLGNLQSVWKARGLTVLYYQSPVNLGFGVGHNLAVLRLAEHVGSRHLFLNVDVLFDRECVKGLADCVNPDVGVVASGPSCFSPNFERLDTAREFPSFSCLLWRLVSKTLGMTRSAGKPPVGRMACDWLSGCFFIMDSSTFRTIGGFDKRFFLYFEEVDLFKRSGMKGTNVYCSDKRIIHFYGAGSYKSVRLFCVHVMSYIKYLMKWM